MITKIKAGKKEKRAVIGIHAMRKGNGWEVRKEHEPKKDNKGFPVYDPGSADDAMVFTEPGEALSYIEECMGADEHMAHEAAEEAAEYGA